MGKRMDTPKIEDTHYNRHKRMVVLQMPTPERPRTNNAIAYALNTSIIKMQKIKGLFSEKSSPNPFITLQPPLIFHDPFHSE